MRKAHSKCKSAECVIFLTGAPDAPTDMKLVAFRVDGAKTVSVNISWTPGYSGGYDQVFTVHYRVKGSDADLVEESVGNPDNNMCTIQGLYPKTQYEFTIQASNQAGKSQASALTQVTTPGNKCNNHNLKFLQFDFFSFC